MKDDVGGGAKGHGGDDDFVARADIESGERNVERGGAGTDGDGGSGSDPCGEVVLETLHFGTSRHPARAKGVNDFDFGFTD